MELMISLANQFRSCVGHFALRCAVELDIAGHIQGYDRPMPLKQLARSIPIPPQKDAMLGRLMALLVQKEVFAQNEEGYTLTPISKLLTKDSNLSFAVLAATDIETQYKHLPMMSKWFKDDGPDTIFAMANDGKQFWDVLREKPHFGDLFDKTMVCLSTQAATDLVSSYPHIFDGLNSLVDIGGGTGITVKIIAAAFPLLRCVLFDLPHVVVKATEVDSFHVVAGDMFEKVPPADAILLKNVLHDWTDDDCLRILKRCKEAIEPKKDYSKVIVVDIILDFESTDNPKETETLLLFDVDMMCLTGSKERNKQEWHNLILDAGYSGYKMYPTRLGVDSVMELYP